MPTIVEAAEQLALDGLPVLFLDTCVLLDVIRTPLRRIPGCIQSAVTLVDLHAHSRCRMVASSMIQNEWAAHEQSVVADLDRRVATHDQDALAFHEACELVNAPLLFGKPSYQPAGLATKLRDLAALLLRNAIHLLPSNETTVRASDRTTAGIRPAQKAGGGHKDCIIIEEYLEVCRLLQAAGFAKKKAFCSSNTKDYQDGGKLHGTLAGEFDSVGLVFTNALHWAVNELKNA